MGFAQDYQMYLGGEACIALSDWRALKLEGEDRLEWLQGQITNDAYALAEVDQMEFCLCTAKGSIEGYGVLCSDAMCIAPAQTVSVLQSRIEKYVILEDVSSEVTSLPVFAVFSHGQTRYVTESPLPALCQSVLRSHRLKLGLPWFPEDFPTPSFPNEMGEAFFANTVSLTKGCYLGQEVVHRIFARGRTHKQFETWVCKEPVPLEGGVTTCLFEEPGRWSVGGKVMR